MALPFFLDQHVPRAIALGLRLRGVDVVTAAEDGAAELDDSALMDRASELGRILVTFDDDLLAEANRRQQGNLAFSGLVFAHPLRVPIGCASGPGTDCEVRRTGCVAIPSLPPS